MPKIHEKNTLFLRHSVGTAQGENGEYEMSASVADYSPIVRLPDGRWVTFGWAELLELADAAALQETTA